MTESGCKRIYRLYGDLPYVSSLNSAVRFLTAFFLPERECEGVLGCDVSFLANPKVPGVA